MDDIEEDTNIDNYSTEDLLNILDLEEPSIYEIQTKSDQIINRLKLADNRGLVNFMKEVKARLSKEFGATYLNNAGRGESNPQNNPETQIGNWWQNQYPAQSDPNQMDKITDRKQKVQMYKDNEHMVLNRERLGVNNTHETPIAQGTINPTLRNITTRTIVLDSQYRSVLLPYVDNDPNARSSSTNYSVNLSETIKNVVAIKLQSVQIPKTWYAFDEYLGNTCFWIKGPYYCDASFGYTGNVCDTSPVYPDDSCAIWSGCCFRSGAPPTGHVFNKCKDGIVFDISWASVANRCCCGADKYTIPNGNYTPEQLADAVSNATYAGTDSNMFGWINKAFDASYNAITGKIEFTSTTIGSFDLIFYSTDQTYTCPDECGPAVDINGTLGWYLGFRNELNKDTDRPDCIPCVAADGATPTPWNPFYNTIHQFFEAEGDSTATLVADAPDPGITVIPQAPVSAYGPKYFILVVDEYSNNRLNKGLVNIGDTQTKLAIPNSVYNTGNINYACVDLNIGESGRNPCTQLADTPTVPVIMPNAPRSLTTAQIYTVNQILLGRKQFSIRKQGPTTSDVLAVIPLEAIGQSIEPTGYIYSTAGNFGDGGLREYFGPVDIDRIQVRLVDDAGNTVNLHGCDWVIILTVDIVYQY